MLDLQRAPESIAPFLDWLERSGFRLVEYTQKEPGDFYNQYAVYDRDGVRVVFQVDRGDWGVVVAAPGFDEPRGADVWEAYLDDFEPAGDLSSLEQQIDFLTRRMNEAVRAATDDPTCEAKLKAISLDWGRRRLGITGYEQRDVQTFRAAMPPRSPQTRPLP